MFFHYYAVRFCQYDRPDAVHLRRCLSGLPLEALGGKIMEYKNFAYIDVQAEESMPLLISAAAIQLTYGLENFRLDYFNNIYIY